MFQTRQHRYRTRLSNTSADRATCLAARDSALDRHPPMRCKRDGRGLVRRRSDSGSTGRAYLDAAGRVQFAAAEGLRRGAYVLADAPNGKPGIILIGTGSEVSLIVAARQKLTEKEINIRIVSMPSWELFDAQSRSYRNSVFPPSARARLAVEAGVTQGWCKYAGGDGDVIGVDRFGASVPGEAVMRETGFSVENVCGRAIDLVNRKREAK